MRQKDWTQEKRIIEALIPLGYGREALHKKLVDLGFKIGERKAGQLLREVRKEYVHTKLEGNLIAAVIGN